MGMKVVRSPDEMQALALRESLNGASIGFAPTMGYLHEGHLTLARRAREENDIAAVSIYVNPSQFVPGEDLDRYPRDEARDLERLEREGIDWVYIPTDAEIYGTGFSTFIEPPPAARGWCGDSRPGHFRGVCTIIAILLNTVRPARMYVGQKDAQQAAVIRQLIESLRFPAELAVCPTVREPDGLAMSSRNAYLSAEDRAAALSLSGALMDGLRAFRRGERDTQALLREGLARIGNTPGTRLDYMGVADHNTFEPVASASAGDTILGAMFVGETRLIDNMILTESE